MSDSVIAPTPPWIRLTLTSLVDSFLQGLRDRLGGTLHVGFHDQRQGAHLALSHLLEHVFQLGRLLFGELHTAVLALAEQRDFAGAFLVRHHHQFLAGRRHFG